jgi:hypothetical protein
MLTDRPDSWDRIAESYLDVLRRFGPEARHVTDKRPENFRFMGFVHKLLPNARFIHCRRNLLDNGASLYMTPFRVRSPFAHTREDVVFYVEQYLRLMDHWRTVVPDGQVLDLEYEELVTNLEGTARRIVAFCGLEWSDACLHPERNRRTVTTPSNWQTRQAVYGSSVGRWKRYEPWLGPLRALSTDR